MQMEQLQKDMIAAMKARDKVKENDRLIIARLS